MAKRSAATLLAPVPFPSLAMLAGCARLTSFTDVLSELPADEMLDIDGQWVHVERVGTGQPLVLLHGFGGSTYCWRKVGPALADRFEVISIDLNGFGYTERPESEFAYSFLGQVDLVLSVMDALDLPIAHFAGHSYGGDVALIIAAEHPDRVLSLTLIDGGVTATERIPGVPAILMPFANWIVRQFVLDEETIRWALEDAVFDPSIVTDEMVREYLARLTVAGLSRMLRGFSDGESLNAPPIDFKTITQPTLVLWGAEDPVFNRRRALLLAASLPNSSVWLLEETGHLPMEERPESLAGAIRRFLTVTGSGN